MILQLSLDNDAKKNASILQKAIDAGGTIRVEEPGVYDVEGPIMLGNDTSLEFGAGVSLRRVGGETKPFLTNKGIFTGEWNHHIRIEGLHLITNNVDLTHFSILPGLRGHLAFMGVCDMVIRDYEVLDLTRLGYGILICRFENILLEQLHIEGNKDGVHLDNGKKFTIRDSRFGTYDDAIALNAYDYCLSTADYGTLEDGLIENCHDLDLNDHVGYFCRMLPGVWTDWHKGMEVQNSTLAVYDEKLYSVCLPLPPEEREKPLISEVPPTHESGIVEAGGIPWRYVRRSDGRYEATCHNITFRNVYLHKNRTGIGFTLSKNVWADSVPGDLKMPVLSDLVLDRIHADPGRTAGIIAGAAAAQNVRVCNSTMTGTALLLSAYPVLKDRYPVCDISFTGVKFEDPDMMFADIRNGRAARIRCINCQGPDNGKVKIAGDVRIDIAASDLEIEKIDTDKRKI